MIEVAVEVFFVDAGVIALGVIVVEVVVVFEVVWLL